MKKKIILIGGGGHCKSCIDVIEGENKFEIANLFGQEGFGRDGVYTDYSALERGLYTLKPGNF